MPKIIDIKPELITIGMDNGEMLEVFPGELNFKPHLNDEVEVFRSSDNDRILITKKQQFAYQQAYEQPNQGTYTQTRMYDNSYDYQTNYYAPVPRGKYVNKWIYLIITFFFGYLGLQHFYSGKIKKGILSCIFCWTYIPFLISCVDFFKVLFKPTNQNEQVFIEHKQ